MRMLKYLGPIALVLASMPGYAQQDSLVLQSKPDPFQVIEIEKRQATGKKSGKTNFEHWSYSQKKHAAVGYLGSIAQGGYSNNKSTSTWHYDLGVLYQGKWVKTKNFQLNMHAWVEHTNLLSGSDPKQFAKDLDMLSVPNASDATDAGFSIEYFHIENFFFNGLWDVSVGKLEPTFYVSNTPYSGWDKMTLFSKTTASDPVPDMDAAFGVFTEVNLTDFISFGAQVLDDNPRNAYFDPGNFFGNTTYNYQAFVRWTIPSKNKYYSYHIFNLYTYPTSGEKASGNGWMYIGNQGISERLILTLKLSNGSGRVLQYNAAYTAGFVYLNPLNRLGDQAGAAFLVNEISGQLEYGIDAYYKLYLQDWVSVAGSLQGYYTKSENFAFVPGVRMMMTY